MSKDRRTAMVGTLVVALFLSLLTLLAPGKVLAVYDCFLTIEAVKQGKIEAEKTERTKGSDGSIDIISWSFGEILQISAAATAGQYVGRPVMQDLKVTMRTGRASPKLFQAAFSKEVIKKAELNVYSIDDKGNKALLLKITLSNAIISSILNLGNSKSTEARPIEEVTFKLIERGKIKFVYVPDGVEFEYEIDSTRAR